MEIIRTFKYATVFTLLKALPVRSGRDICSVQHGTVTYCEERHYCCDNNTRCCGTSYSAWELVGVVLAVLLGLCMCIFCAIFLTKKKKRPRQLIHPRGHLLSPGSISTIGRNTGNTYQNFNITNVSYPYFGYDNVSGDSGNGRPSTTTLELPPYSQEDPNANSFPPPPAYKERP